MIFPCDIIELSGANNLENSEVSSIVEGVDDIWIRMIAYFFETDEVAKVSLNVKECICAQAYKCMSDKPKK